MTPSLVAVFTLPFLLLAMEVQGIEEGDIDGSLGLGRLFISGTYEDGGLFFRMGFFSVPPIEMTECCGNCRTELFEFIKRDYSFCHCIRTIPGVRPATQPAEENSQSTIAALQSTRAFLQLSSRRPATQPEEENYVDTVGICKEEDYGTGIHSEYYLDNYYWSVGSPAFAVDGRPFSVDGKYRTAGSQTLSMLKHEESWKMGDSPLVSLSNPFNEEIGRYWLQHAEAEHASIASFARHTLQLMSLGAPAKLLMASQAASIDEVQHAKICYNFASAFLGSDLGPGSLDVEGSLGSMEVKDIIQSLITEGCVGETLAAMEAHLAAKYAEDPAIKAALSQIALEETKHSQLAWDTIEWILQKFPDSQSFAEEVFKAELKEYQVPVRSNSSQLNSVFCQESEKEASFHRHGLLVKGDRDKVRQVGIKDIIVPIYTAGFKNVHTISKLITELDIGNL